MKKKLILLLACLLSTGLAMAQTRQVTGTVVSGEDGQPILKASVMVTGTLLGAHTDANGRFILTDVPATAKTLTITCTGMKTQEIEISQNVLVALAAEVSKIEEVVITVPYGVVKKESFTGSAGVIDKKIISSSQVSSVTKALQGSVAGLQSFSISGQPGEDASIYIRGIGSINASTAPLYVVDGAPYSGALSSISSQDIESVTVLKDAAAATLYGSRAANGVIMITTKQGAREATPSIEFSAKYGISKRAVQDYKQLSTDDYFMLQWEALRNKEIVNGRSEVDAASEASLKLVNSIGINPYGRLYPQPVGTDGRLIAGIAPLWDDNWEDALSQKANYTDLSVRLSGGTRSNNYYISLGYLDDQGAVICSGFKRYTLRTSITSDIRSWMQAGLTVSGTHSVQDYPKQDDTAITNVILAARSIPSFYPVYERDRLTGAYLRDENGNKIYDYGPYRLSSFDGYNFAQSMLHDKNEIKRDAASIRGFLSVTPVKGFSYKMSLSTDYNSRFTHVYVNPTYGKPPLTGYVSKYNYRTTNMTFNNIINWAQPFGKSNEIRLMAGQEYFEYNTAKFGGSRKGVITDGYYEPDVASTLTGFTGNSDQYKLLSFFGNAELSFNQRVFFSASIRTDGSSRFHPDNRWGTFWSVGGSWRISKENFMKNNQFLSMLTLRASYGGQGNDNVGFYAYPELYSIGSFLGETTLHTLRLPTPELSWETNLNLNVGLDFGFFNNRLNGTLEYFERASKDLLFPRDLVPSSGFSGINANIGKLNNYGWELTLNATVVQSNDFTWRLSLNATTYKNKIMRLPTEVMWMGSKKWVEGGSLYDYWLFEWAGVNPENGNPQWYYYDDDGNKQVTDNYASLKSERDKIKLGSSLPKLSGGFQTDMSYRNLSLSVLFSYAIGGKLYNSDKLNLMLVSGGSGNTMSADMINRWTPENTNTDIPRLVHNMPSNFNSGSSRWLVDRSFLRMKTVTVSYRLPAAILDFMTLKDATIFLQGENLLTFNKQQGLDPEQPINGSVAFRYPAMKTVSIGINVKL